MAFAIRNIIVLLSALYSAQCFAQKASDVTTSNPLRDVRIVVSVRTLKPQGRSYWNLNLYSGDGRLVRQLTKTKSDDTNPVIAPDGKSVAFRRTHPRYKNDLDLSHSLIYQVKLDGSGLKKFDEKSTAPQWYLAAQKIPHTQGFIDRSEKDYENDRTYTDPTGQYAYVSQASLPDKLAWIRNLQTGRQDLITSMPGYPLDRYSLGNYLSFENWINQGPLLAAIFSIHIGSTDGNAYFMVDAKRSQLHELSANGALFYLVDKLPALFVLSEERYRTPGDGDRLANCRYLDLWDGNYKRHRLSPDLSIFHGASIWNPVDKKVYNILPMDEN